jgi:archaellum biogenesis ATPase FlaH
MDDDLSALNRPRTTAEIDRAFAVRRNGHSRAVVEDDQPPADDPFSPVVVPLDDVQSEPIDWLWPGRVAIGKMTLLCGDPGNGKSLLTMDLAARVSRGRPWPDDLTIDNPVGGVVVLSAEDDLADTIRPRLEAAGADLTNIIALTGINWFDAETGKAIVRPFSLERDLPSLERAIDQLVGCRLIIIDVLDAYLGRTDSHRNSEVRGLLSPLAELAARKHVAVVCVSHLNKSSNGAAMYRAIGSIGIIGASRAAWLVAKDKQSPARRLLLGMKNNLAADTSGLAFGIVSDGAAPFLAWESGAVTMTADEALAPDPHEHDAPERDDAGEWLKSMLADGPVSSSDLKRQAAKDGIAWRTVNRAKADLGIHARKAGFNAGWTWDLTDTTEECQAVDDFPP